MRRVLLALLLTGCSHPAPAPALPTDIPPTRAVTENEAIRIALNNDVRALLDVRIAWAELVAATQRLKLRSYLVEQTRTAVSDLDRLEESDRAERAMHEKHIARDRFCAAVGLGACTLDVQLEEPSLAMPPDDAPDDATDATGPSADIRIAREELRMAIGSYELWHRTITPRITDPREAVTARLHEIDLALDVRKARAKLER